MINNSDTVRVTRIDYRVRVKYLSNNVLHNRYFIERMQLTYLFRWSYRKGDYKTMTFEAILFNGGQYDK